MSLLLLLLAMKPLFVITFLFQIGTLCIKSKFQRSLIT